MQHEQNQFETNLQTMQFMVVMLKGSDIEHKLSDQISDDIHLFLVVSFVCYVWSNEMQHEQNQFETDLKTKQYTCMYIYGQAGQGAGIKQNLPDQICNDIQH